MRRAGSFALVALTVLATACQLLPTNDDAPEAAETPVAGAPTAGAATAGAATAGSSASATETAPLPAPKPDPAMLPPPPAPDQVPHIYMALQDADDGQPISVVFAIDAARNGTPSDDPAIRLTPESGHCNPQEMTRYDFPPGTTPTVGATEANEGLAARDLPAFMAIAVTNEMLTRGIATEPEQTRPLNICTRKLWEQLVIVETGPPSGQ